MRRPIFAGLLVILMSSIAHATNVNDVTSDLSNLNTAPTQITLTTGSNVITGRTGTLGGIDRDFFRFTVPPGLRLSAINLIAFDGPSLSFLGVERGTTFTDPTTTAAAQLLGYVHFSASMLGTDILDNMGAGAGAQGFTGALGPGDYSFWLQENSTPTVNYQLDFVLSAAPIVPALPVGFGVLLGVGLLLSGAGWLRARRAGL